MDAVGAAGDAPATKDDIAQVLERLERIEAAMATKADIARIEAAMVTLDDLEAFTEAAYGQMLSDLRIQRGMAAARAAKAARAAAAAAAG